jgi:hypothetical protein
MKPEKQRIALLKVGGWIFDGDRPIWCHGRPPQLDADKDPLTDANAALQVVEMMRGKGWHFTLTDHTDYSLKASKGFYCKFEDARWRCIPPNGTTLKTAQLAICRSALIALKLWEEEA